MSRDKTFCLLLSENCNFACKYCYERSGKGHNKNNMSKQVASDTLDYAFKNCEKEVSLSLFGGEPTMNPAVIDFVCTRGKELAKEQNKGFVVGLITNGSLMNRNLYDILKKHLDVLRSVQLSIDGNQETQDTTRVKVDGSGSFKDVEKAIPYWKALFPGINIHGVLNQDNMGQMFENYKFFREEWGVGTLWFLPAKDDRYTQTDVEIYDDQMGKLTDYIMEETRRVKNVDLLRQYQPLNKCLDPEHPLSKPCGIGEGYLVVTTKGDIWPCHHLYFIDTDNDTKLGDIYNGVNPNRSRIWEAYESEDMIGCENCDHTHCFRCPAENYEDGGSPFIQMTMKGLHCKFMDVDVKYQEQIKEELLEMGLIKNGKREQGGCSGCGDEGVCNAKSRVRDFDDVSPSKTGCDVVQQVMDDGTVTDLSDGTIPDMGVESIIVEEPITPESPDELKVPEMAEVKVPVAPEEGLQISDDANKNLKNLLNDIIGVMVEYHNKL